MDVMEIGFQQGEENWLSPTEDDDDDDFICDICGKIIERGKGNLYYESDGRFWCERCARERAIEVAIDKIYDEMEEA